MKGSIKSKNSEGVIIFGNKIGDFYKVKTDMRIPSDWGVGDDVDFNFGPQGSTGTISNKGVSIRWIAVDNEGDRIIDTNP